MNETQRLLGIALAAIALDGCRGGSTQRAQQYPNASPTPVRAYGYHAGGIYVPGHAIGGAAAAGAFAGGATGVAPRRSWWSRIWSRGNSSRTGGYSRTLGGRGFGGSGFHGGG